MPTNIDKYLDPAALDETVFNIRQIVEDLEEEMQNLPYARPDGLYPDMTVGAVIGADETAQWATRESTGSGSATVRSVQGAAVAYNQLIQLSRSTTFGDVTITCDVDAQTVTINGATTGGGGRNQYIAREINIIQDHKYLFIDTCNYASQSGGYTTWAISQQVSPFAQIVSMLSNTIFTADASGVGWLGKQFGANSSYDNVTGQLMLFDLTQMFGSGNEPSTVAEFEQMYPAAYYPYSAPTLKPVRIAGIASTTAQVGELDAIEWTAQTLRAAGSVADELTIDELVTRVGERAYQSGDESDATVRTDGTTTYYPLATPTTTPISPALPMTYKVQQGGTEYIVVPDGEVSAAPVLTVAEPVNMSTELARIWAAIEQLQSRGTAQLSRTDTVSIDEVQKDTAGVAEIDTADVAEIDTIKEVKE